MDIALILSEYYKGQEWTVHGNTYEALIWYDEKNSLSKPTLEELTEKWNEYLTARPWEELRQKRNKLLTDVDWVTLKAYSTQKVVPKAWRDYMQALRDLPANTEDPENPVWPVAPSP